MPEVTLRHVKFNELESVRQLLLDLYTEIYSDQIDDPFFSVDRYNERLTRHAGREGWETVIGYDEDEPVGYAYAAPLPPGARWWTHQLAPLAPDFTEETGNRTLALFEIMVRTPWRGTGAAHAIHEELLSRRTEERVTLLVEPSHPASSARTDPGATRAWATRNRSRTARCTRPWCGRCAEPRAALPGRALESPCVM
jgi:GNAT superfamily N-acetyltransferase